MKKFVAIPLLFLILFTGMTVNLASHYCGGKLVASRISFSGEPATCGMEHDRTEKPGINVPDHSCQNFTSSYTLNNNYVPSKAQVADDNLPSHSADLSFLLSLIQEQQDQDLTVKNRPPGSGYNSSDVDLDVICIFRI